MKWTALVLALAQLTYAQTRWNFDCRTMDIPSNVEPLASFPEDITTSCIQLDKNTISVLIESVGSPGKSPLPYSGVMVQVRSRDQPIGNFRTRRPTQSNLNNPNAVGDLHEVSCNGEAQTSTDSSPKQKTEGRWYNSDNLDLTRLADLKCVISLIDVDETSRFIKFAVDVRGRQLPASPQNPALPNRNQFGSETAPRPTTTTTTTVPTTTTTERNWNAGAIRVEGYQFPKHCVGDSRYGWVPLPHTGCSQYLTVTHRDGKARASHYCTSNGADCFDTRSCMCRRCQEVSCKNSPITANMTIPIYDKTNTDTGLLRWSRARQPGQTTGFTYSANAEGNTNPNFLRGRPDYKSTSTSTSNTASSGRNNNNRGRGQRNGMSRSRSPLGSLTQYLGSLTSIL